ncbi:hypothetical protein GCM10027053_48570 [Intrasporangium mesophilum]
MSTPTGGVALTPHEALARQIIVQRVAAKHHAPRTTRRHIRAALLLRSLAERLDPPAQPEGEGRMPHGAQPHAASRLGLAGAHAGAPRPWSAAPRAAHRHS